MQAKRHDVDQRSTSSEAQSAEHIQNNSRLSHTLEKLAGTHRHEISVTAMSMPDRHPDKGAIKLEEQHQ